jgi:hypothetical protein
MALKSKSLGIACLLVVGWAAAAQAACIPAVLSPCRYSITGGGGEAQIGDGLLLPIQPTTIGGSPAGTGTMFPPLLIPPNPAKLVKQTGADPKKMTVPPGAFFRKASRSVVGVAVNNPAAFQVETNIEFSGPGPAFGSATASAGGRTGAATATIMGIPAGAGQVRFSKTANQFGGPSRTRVVPATVIEVWAHGSTITAPCKHPAFGGSTANPNDSGCIAVMVEAHPMTLGVAGAPIASPAETTPGGAVMTKGVRVVSVPTSMGLVAKSAVAGKTAPISNMATTEGFPFTTGMITISQPAAKGSPEVFKLTGGDNRVAGVGTISLVTGGLSNRVATGPNANRSWARYTLPEPGAVLGAAAALAMLGLCHGLVRRRSR